MQWTETRANANAHKTVISWSSVASASGLGIDTVADGKRRMKTAMASWSKSYARDRQVIQLRVEKLRQKLFSTAG